MLIRPGRPARSFAYASLLFIAACDNNAPSDAATPKADSAAPAATATSNTAATKDWTAVLAATPEGGFRMGNPDAPVKLIEFASLTCPHCRDFHKAAMPKLKGDYIKSGQVSYELRNFVLNGPDFAATLLARCQGPAAFFKLVDTFFEQQDSWTAPFAKLTEADQQRLQALPQNQQIAGLADAGGLDDFMRTRGLPKAKFNQCLTNEAEIAKLSAIRNEAISKYQLTGTPSFVINGETQKDVFDWASLEPKIQEALR